MAEPPLTIHAFHDDGPGNLVPTRVVIHATCPDIGYPHASAPGTAHGTAEYFTMSSSGGSAHYVVDPDDEQHCIADAHIAWHAPPNPHSIGIEICAEGGNYARSYTRAQWLSAEVWPAVVRAAARTRELCDRFAIPLVRLSVADLLAGHHGICGHVDVSNAWHESDHSDPGPEFPWPEFMAAVLGHAAPAAPTPPPEEDLMKIDLEFAADGSFRGVIGAESGSRSALYGSGWINVSAAYGPPGGLIAHVRVCAIGADGNVMGPAADRRFDLHNNQKDGLQLPDGAVMATVEGTLVAPDALVTALWLPLPR